MLYEVITAYDLLIKDYHNGELKYKELKDTVAEALVELTTPFRQKKEELLKDKKQIESLALRLSEKAQDVAADTIRKVRSLTGLPRYAK